MTTPTRIAVGSDGSDTAARAVEMASTLSLAFDVPLVVATAWERGSDTRSRAEAAGTSYDTGAEWARRTVADATAVARQAGVEDVRGYTPVGAPDDALENLARDHEGTLLVVGTVGLDRTAERVLGNIPHHLTHHADADVLLVRSTDPDHDWSTIALATDGSDTSLAACRLGLALARALDATPVLVSAGKDADALEQTLLDAADAIDDGEGPLELEAAIGANVSDALTDAATGHGLLVLGNRRMHGAGRLLGSVPNDLTHRVPTDILLVNTTR